MDDGHVRRFADFQLDLRTNELRRAGRRIPLQRQPGLTLALLVSRAGDLVTRDDLRRAIWGDSVHVDYERGLNYCIRQARAALDDDARAPRFIETVPRQGYRFIQAEAPPSALDPPPPLPTVPRRPGRRWLAAAFAAGVALTALSGRDAARSVPRSVQHHLAAASLVRAAHDAAFGTAGSRAHHAIAASAVRAVHDLVF
jgi:DNA-binding winged helix-turn-helix (wHTH) protein